MTYTYSWQRCSNTGTDCNATTVTGNSYALSTADVGFTLRVVVTATNAAGSGSATSLPSAVISSNNKKRARSLTTSRSTKTTRRTVLRAR